MICFMCVERGFVLFGVFRVDKLGMFVCCVFYCVFIIFDCGIIGEVLSFVFRVCEDYGLDICLIFRNS